MNVEQDECFLHRIEARESPGLVPLSNKTGCGDLSGPFRNSWRHSHEFVTTSMSSERRNIQGGPDSICCPFGAGPLPLVADVVAGRTRCHAIDESGRQRRAEEIASSGTAGQDELFRESDDFRFGKEPSMATPTQDTHLINDRQVAIPLIEQTQGRCPHCNGSGWIKTFTPWGCPSSTACKCRPPNSATGSGEEFD